MKYFVRNPPFHEKMYKYKRVWIYIGKNSWEQSKSDIEHRDEYFITDRPSFLCHDILCLPPFDDPAIYKWNVLNRFIFIIDSGHAGDEYAIRLIKSLFICKAEEIVYLSPELERKTFKLRRNS